MNVLLHETSDPPLREVIGRLLGAATRADIAVANVRLGVLDLHAGELARVTHCRVLLGRLDAQSLAGTSAASVTAESLARLLTFVTSERVEIRSAGMGAWLPDFSVYRGLRGSYAGRRGACLIGAHYFAAPPAAAAFTCVLIEPHAVTAALHRFDELWESGHDVRDVVASSIRQFAELMP